MTLSTLLEENEASARTFMRLGATYQTQARWLKPLKAGHFVLVETTIAEENSGFP